MCGLCTCIPLARARRRWSNAAAGWGTGCGTSWRPSSGAWRSWRCPPAWRAPLREGRLSLSTKSNRSTKRSNPRRCSLGPAMTGVEGPPAAVAQHLHSQPLAAPAHVGPPPPGSHALPPRPHPPARARPARASRCGSSHCAAGSPGLGVPAGADPVPTLLVQPAQVGLVGNPGVHLHGRLPGALQSLQDRLERARLGNVAGQGVARFGAETSGGPCRTRTCNQRIMSPLL